MKNDTYKILAGFLIGAMGGLLTGLMIAPESGKNTRKKILEEAESLRDDLLTKAEEQYEHTKKKLSEKIDELAEVGRNSINDLKDKSS
jgi:gas vesicle protein